MTEPRPSRLPSTDPATIKVLIVDDHALFRTGVRLVLADQDQIEVVGEAYSGEDALRQAKRLNPNICLMDLNMPGGMGGIEATRKLRRLLPSCQVIALTVLCEEPFASVSLASSGESRSHRTRCRDSDRRA